jgi:hypothetical protein
MTRVLGWSGLHPRAPRFAEAQPERSATQASSTTRLSSNSSASSPALRKAQRRVTQPCRYIDRMAPSPRHPVAQAVPFFNVTDIEA